jgi:DNA-binding MarR family transcriptional regulator
MARSRSSTANSKNALVENVSIAVRRMGAQSVVMSKIVADHFSLNQTDLEVLDLIQLRGEASAGELAAATGLSSGSVTALLDRLESAGYIERFGDPGDRRRVLVRIRPNAIKPIVAMYGDIQTKMHALWSTFDPDQLRTILDFITRSTDLAVECSKDMRLARPRPKTGVRSSGKR